MLEDLLQNYEGTVFLVSHDRSFLDNVATSTIAFEGDGRWREYEGGVQDWLVQSRRSQSIAAAATAAATRQEPRKPAAAAPKTAAAAAAPRKLSYKDQRELQELPARIDALEQEQKALQAELADGSLYVRDGARAAQLTARGAQIEDELMTALERWEALGQL